MSEDKLRAQFEAWWFSSEVKSPILVSEHSMFFADQAWQACANIKDAEIMELKERLFEIQNAAIELNAKVAMMSEAIKEIWYSNSTPIAETKYQEVINATEAGVTKWVIGVRVEMLRTIAKDLVELADEAEELEECAR
jgi:hypothetical protein